MPSAPLPLNEEERLLALERYAILDTLPEQHYNDLTFLASHICGAPISLVSIVAQDRQWFKSKIGIDVCETSRDLSFCAHALAAPTLLEVPDATLDPRFSDNPMVTGGSHIRFYAGAPLVTPEGYTLGTLCVADYTPRHLNDTQREALIGLARQVVSQMELWRTVKRLEIASMERNIALQVAQTNTTRLQASENRFRQFMDNSPVAAFIKDANGRFVYVNAGMRRTFSLKETDLLGHTDFDWLEPGVAAEVMENDRRVIQSGLTEQFLENVPMPDGQLCHWLVFKFLLQDAEKGQLLGGVALDITEMKRAQELKNEFVSVVSHELRTPLTSIRGALSLLRGGVAGELPVKAHDMVEVAHRNAERLMVLISDILDIEKIESGKMRFDMQPIRLETLLAQATEASLPYARSFDVALAYESPDTEMWLCGDEGRLMQILANLLSNAIKFTPAGGQIMLRARCLSEPADGACRMRIEIQDQGTGVPDAFVPRLFERFSQADASPTRKLGGTGLGLAIARALVEKHGGEIGYLPPPTISSAPDAVAGANLAGTDFVGATFFFDLPAFVSAEAVAYAASEMA